MPAPALRNESEDMEKAGNQPGIWDKPRFLCSLGLTGWAPLHQTHSDKGGVVQ